MRRRSLGRRLGGCLRWRFRRTDRCSSLGRGGMRSSDTSGRLRSGSSTRSLTTPSGCSRRSRPRSADSGSRSSRSSGRCSNLRDSSWCSGFRHWSSRSSGRSRRRSRFRSSFDGGDNLLRWWRHGFRRNGARCGHTRSRHRCSCGRRWWTRLLGRGHRRLKFRCRLSRRRSIVKILSDRLRHQRLEVRSVQPARRVPRSGKRRLSHTLSRTRICARCTPDGRQSFSQLGRCVRPH